jgi:hypothetical protein
MDINMMISSSKFQWQNFHLQLSVANKLLLNLDEITHSWPLGYAATLMFKLKILLPSK